MSKTIFATMGQIWGNSVGSALIGFFSGDSLSLTLLSSLPSDDCVERLRLSVDRPWTVFGTRPVVGRVDRTVFRGNKRLSYRNSFQTHVTATLIPDGAGTRIDCRFGMHPLVTAFMVVWFGGILSIGVPLCWVTARNLIGGTVPPSAASLVGVVMAPVMLGFGYGLVRICRWLARDEAAFLTEFLCATLDARIVTKEP